MDGDENRDGGSWFGRFVEGLRMELESGLPGPGFQAKMAPSHREMVNVSAARTRPHREGAVLVILYPGGGEVLILYTVRRADLTDHAGQISFPGGRREEGETLQEAAVREAREEVGVTSEDLEVLGELTPIYIPPSRYIVHPYLAVARSKPEFSLQESEVERILEVRLGDLQDPENRRSEIWTINNERSRVPWFHIAGERIWGATAMMTNELLVVVERVWR